MDRAEVLIAAKQYAAEVRSRMQTNAIFLYGSYAKGSATKDSDIDIAVIVDQIPEDYLSTMSLLWKLTRSVNMDIEPVLLTKADTASGFLGTVKKTGIAI